MASSVIKNNNISHGSNANGKYVKFPDGTLICWVEHKTTTAINSAWGGVYESTTQQDLGTWPHAFISTPNVVVSPLRYSGSVTAYLEQVSDTSTTAVGTSYYWCPRSHNSAAVGATIIGIGFWK